MSNKRTQKKYQRQPFQRAANPFGGFRLGNGGQPGNMYVIPESVVKQVIANFAPQKQKSEMYSPGAPIRPIPEITPKAGPRGWNYPASVNLSGVDRTLGNTAYDIPSFQQLRMLAKMYYGVTLCERVVLDMIPNLELDIVPVPGLLEDGEDTSKYQKAITFYKKWFEKPDKQLDIHSWLRKAYREQTQIDELYIYKKPNRGGGLYALQILDGSTMKPLLDEQGIMPQPPYPAYQQFPYGAPGGLYTSDQFIHYQESPSSDTPYGFSRVERIILNVNIALRKQQKDLYRYTEGNIPAGIMEVPEAANWTPDQIDAFEQSWNAMLAGNMQQATRIKFTQPGMKYTSFEQAEAQLHLTEFDEFLLKVSTASYGLSMQDIAFTGDIHKSSGDSQQNVTFRRSLYPFTSVYAKLLTNVIHEDFNDPRFMVVFRGFEEAEDVASKATAYSMLTGAGILGISDAAKLMKLPEDKDAAHIGRILVGKDGPIFLDDIAAENVRKAAVEAQMAGYKLAANPPEQQGESGQEEPAAQSGQPDQPKAKQEQAPPKKEASETDATMERVATLLTEVQAYLREVRAPNAPPADLISRQGSCQCEVCTERNGQPAQAVQPPYHDGCDCTVVPKGMEHVERASPEAETPPSHRAGDSGRDRRAPGADDPGRAAPGDLQPGTSGPNSSERAIAADYRRWRTRALEDVKAGRPLRPFLSEVIPEQEQTALRRLLPDCATTEEVRATFECVRTILSASAPPLERSAGHDGVMVAFLLAPEVSAQLAVPGGEEAENLHLTLAYLGDASMLSKEQQRNLIGAMGQFAASHSTLDGRLSGVGRFTAPEGEPEPVYASVDAPHLPTFRQALVEALNEIGLPPDQAHGFTPHLTLAYVPPGEEAPVQEVPPLLLRFDRLCLAIGDERYIFLLTGRSVQTPATEYVERRFQELLPRAVRAAEDDGTPKALAASVSRPGGSLPQSRNAWKPRW